MFLNSLAPYRTRKYCTIIQITKITEEGDDEILTKGYKAVVSMISFIQHFKEGKNDYTKERHRWLDQQSVEDVLQEMNKWKNVNDIAEYYGEHLALLVSVWKRGLY